MEKHGKIVVFDSGKPLGTSGFVYFTVFFFFAFKVREKGVRVIQSGKSMDSEDEEKQKV